MTLFPLYIFLLLGFIIPGFLLLNIEGSFTLHFFFIYLIILWSSLRLAYTAMGGRRRLVLLFFYVFVYVFLGVQPTTSVWSKMWPHSNITFSQNLLFYTILLVWLGIVGFEVGYSRLIDFSNKKTTTIKSLSTITSPKQNSIISLMNLAIVSVFTTILVLLAMMYFGPNVFLGFRDGNVSGSEFQGPESSQAANLLVIFGLRGLSSSLLFIVLYLFKNKHLFYTQKNIIRLKVILGYLIVFNLIVSNPLNAPRLWSGGVILTSMLISTKWNGTNSFLRWASLTSIAFLLLFSGTDPRRIFGQQILRGEPITITNTVREVAQTFKGLPVDFNFDSFQIIGYTTQYVALHGYSWGYQVMLPAFFWIPRTVWPNKPIGTPDLVAAQSDLESLNVSSPLWTEGYVNFGWPGVFLFLFIFGFFARKCDDSLSIKQQRPVFLTIITCFFASNTFILLRGDLTSGTMYLQMVVGLLYVVLLFVEKERMKDGVKSA
jgi:hypothetical protein